MAYLSWSRRSFLRCLGASTLAFSASSRADEDYGGFFFAEPQERWFRNATLLDNQGKVHEGVGIHLKDGQLQEVSKQIKHGEDLKGHWIVPSWTDAGSMLGLYEIDLESGTHDHNESKYEHRVRLKPSDAYNPLSSTVAVARAAGFGHTLLHPAFGDTIVGGMSLVQLGGMLPRETAIHERAAILLSLQRGSQASTRMGLAQHFHDMLSKYSPTSKAKKCWLAPSKNTDPYAGMKEEDKIWTRVRDKKLPLVISAHRVDDIDRVIALKKEFDVHMILMGGAEAWMLADRLSEYQLPVLLGPLDIQPSSFAHLRARYDNASILHRAGVKIAFRTGANHHMHFLPSLAGVMVAHGLPFSESIKALTVNMYDMLRIHRVSDISLEGPFTTANFFLCTGDPLQPKNKILRMWIAGREVSLETRQSRLRDRFMSLPD